jgi:hypothetical protein
MKKLLTLLGTIILGFVITGTASAQSGIRANTFSATGADIAINNAGTAIAFHQLTWVKTGTVSTCTVALDTSADGITWSAGGAIAGQTCTSNGQSVITGSIANYVRMNVTTLTGGGTINVTWTGYTATPGGSITFAGAPTGSCSAAQTAVDSTTGDFYSCNGGVWLAVGPGAAGSAAFSTLTAGTNGGQALVVGNGSTLSVTGTGTIAATSAAKWTTARNLAGNSTDGSANVAFSNKFIVQGTTDSGLSGPQFLGALGTGIVKNTTTTGVLSIAVAGDFPTLNQNTTGSSATLSGSLTQCTSGQFATGITSTGASNCSTPAGSGNVSGPVTNTDAFVPQWNGANSLLLKDGLAVATANTTSALVQRDGSGNFSAGTITATLSGNASTVTNGVTAASNFTNAQLVIAGGANKTLATGPAYASTNTASNIVQRDSSGNFSAGTITATLTGNADTVTNGVTAASNFTNTSILVAAGANKTSASMGSDFLFATHTITAGASGVLDMSGGSLFKTTVGSSFTCAAEGCFGFDTGPGKMYHVFANGADSLVATKPVSVTVANNDCPKWVVSGTNISIGTTGAACAASGVSGTTGYIPKFASSTTVGNSAVDDGVTTASTITSTEAIVAPSFSSSASGAGYFQCTQGTLPGVGGANTATLTCPAAVTAYEAVLWGASATGIVHASNSSNVDTLSISAVVGADMTNNTVTATQLAAQYSKDSCTELWGGSGTSFALTSGDDAISNNSCYNDSGVTRTITAVKCRSDNGTNTTTVNPTFGAAGTGTTILSGALTCGSSLAYSSSGTVSNASWTTGTGITPAMSGTLTGTSIAVIVEYTY